jgi:hypothetical protein
MFFDKLWVRIKGEIASLKEDRDTDVEPGKRSGSLLEAIDRRLFPRHDEAQMAPKASEERWAGEKLTEPEHGKVHGAEKTAPETPKTTPGTSGDGSEAALAPLQPNPRKLG